MESGVWIAFFRRIPSSQHDALTLTTTIGTEIILQRFVRLERDFMIVKGRQSGSQDQAQVHVLPYNQIALVTFTKKMTDGEIQEAVGSPGAAGQLAEPDDFALPQAANEPAAAEAAPAPPVAEPTNAGPPAASAKTALPSKSVLLARLRQRLAAEGGKPTNPNP
jgi:hypothetical protein